jgi:hypothetical protein
MVVLTWSRRLECGRRLTATLTDVLYCNLRIRQMWLLMPLTRWNVRAGHGPLQIAHRKKCPGHLHSSERSLVLHQDEPVSKLTRSLRVRNHLLILHLVNAGVFPLFYPASPLLPPPK